MTKYITDELIAQKMSEKGWIEGCDDEHARNQVLAHYECEVTDQWQNPDFSVYEESTADGYSVWIATANDKSINVSEDVYYYENELTDVLYEAIPDYSNIYCDNYDFVEDAITRHYEDLMCRIEDETIDELLDEGYNHKITDPINTLQYIEMISQDCSFLDGSSRAINLTVDEDYRYLNYASQIIKDRARYEIVANHYGLTIERAVKGELIFKELKNEN
ncbi:hypothetical protein DRO61_09350 [Candidatus Bathyarchaeota archaeon]|nr:MAG: hypothetical protein DRO61_09350 [Candidatus Bathyarchaeota archaeon]